MSLRKAITAVFLAAVCASPAVAYDATQTFWDGGFGVPGPVTDWGDTFEISNDMNFYYNTGKLVLANNIIGEGDAQPVGSLDAAIIVQTGDIDGDNDEDIIAASTGTGIGQVVWYENIDEGVFDSTPHFIKDMPYPSIYATDVDGEDGVDIIICNDFVSPNVFWYENDGSGNFTEHGIGSGYNSVDAPGAADFDDDGDIDIVASARNGAGGIRWYENDGNENFTTHAITSPPYYGQNEPFIPTGDINGDDDIDFCLVRTNNAAVDWWENDLDGTGNFILHSIAISYTDPVHPWLADMDMDTDLDIVTSSSGLGSVDWWENDGNGNFGGTANSIASGYPEAAHFAVIDLDYDGDQDVMTASTGGDTLDWWESTDFGDTFTHGEFYTGYDGAYGCWLGDVKGFGLRNALSTARDADLVNWFKLTGDYRETGTLTSSILDIGEITYDHEWKRIIWSSDLPSSTSISFRVRSSNNPGNMGSWSSPITMSGTVLRTILTGDTRYFQYEATLNSPEGGNTPELYDVTVVYGEVTGIEDDGPNGIPKAFSLSQPFPNPAIDGTTIAFALPRACDVDLSLYDIKGRKLKTLARGDYQPGEYSVEVAGLTGGIYLYRLEAGDFADTKKVVVK
ncbi:MAG: T9SS type A sorting domain-containing protein [bacterium]|nr:T9SS type A sorting domain-containing protein [bacterium]